MNKKVKVISILLVAVMMFSFIGCGEKTEPASTTPATETKTESNTSSETPNTASTERQVLKYAVKADVPTLDQHLANSIPSASVGNEIFEGLIRTYLGQVQPGMAESWDISDDGITYTFHLRDAKWSDGEPVTAQNFEFGLKRLMDPATASGYAFIGVVLKNGAKVNTGELPVDELGVKAIDEKTLEIQLENPTEYFLSMLSMMQYLPTRQDYVEKYGKAYAADADKNVYNGPFVVKDWKHEDRIILEKNPNYWNADAIQLDEVQIIVVPEGMTQLAMFENGEIDLVEVPSEVVSQYSDQATYFYNGANDFIKLNMDGTSKMLENKDMRLALNYAINRAEYIMLTTSGLYLPNTRYVLPQVNGVSGEYGTEYPYEAFPVQGDEEQAKSHLQAAMTAMGISDPSQIQLELLTTDAETSRKQAEVLQDQWQKALGIVINIRQVPYKQRLDMESKHEFEMVVGGWAPDYSDPMTYLELWTSDSGYNHGSYRSEAYDKNVFYARTATEPQARMDALFEAEKTLLSDGAIVPLQLRRVALLKNPKLKNFESYFVGLDYDYTRAFFE